MTGVSSYVLSIAGIILLSVVVELVLPDGQMNKYIRSIFSFFIIGVIIAPLPNLLSSKSVSSIFDFEGYQIQQGYIDAMDSSKSKKLSYELEHLLAEEGYRQIKISVVMEEGELAEVKIDLKNLVFDEKALHKDIESIREFITEKFAKDKHIEKEKIVYEI